MDRNGKKRKAVRDDSQHAERSDLKAKARDVLGRADVDAAAWGGKGRGHAQGTPADAARKGRRD